jgi:hypothetical protein
MFSVNNDRIGETTMRLPEVAARLREPAEELYCEELNDSADKIGHRPSGERAPRTSAAMTDALRQQIRDMKEADPELSHAEIGRILNFNPGRVPETLSGKRT